MKINPISILADIAGKGKKDLSAGLFLYTLKGSPAAIRYKDKDGKIWVCRTIQQHADYMNIPVTSLREVLKRLRKSGLIETKSAYNPCFKYTTKCTMIAFTPTFKERLKDIEVSFATASSEQPNEVGTSNANNAVASNANEVGTSSLYIEGNESINEEEIANAVEKGNHMNKFLDKARKHRKERKEKPVLGFDDIFEPEEKVYSDKPMEAYYWFSHLSNKYQGKTTVKWNGKKMGNFNYILDRLGKNTEKVIEKVIIDWEGFSEFVKSIRGQHFTIAPYPDITAIAICIDEAVNFDGKKVEYKKKPKGLEGFTMNSEV